MNACRVDVCVATCRRPQGLQRLLLSLARQRCLPLGTSVRIIVVDNDPEGTAWPVVQGVLASGPGQGLVVHYVRQPVPNLALTRNAAVDHSTGDLLAFIDDDEWAASDWLHQLLQALDAWRADALVGPVQGVLDAGAAAWVRRGRLFDARQQASGTPVQRGCTGNAIVRAEWFRQQGLRFDPRYGLTGGEDMALFEALKSRGARVLWCAEALVSEHVPAARATLRWILGRAFRAAQTYADVLGRPKRTLQVIPWVMYRAVFALSMAAVTLLCWPWRRDWAARAARRCVSNVGQLSTLGSWRYEEYGQHRLNADQEEVPHG